MIQNVISRQIKIMVLEKSRPTYHYRFTFMYNDKKSYFSPDYHYRFVVTREKMLFTATLKIMVLAKFRPTYISL